MSNDTRIVIQKIFAIDKIQIKMKNCGIWCYNFIAVQFLVNCVDSIFTRIE